jgi:hypothetical protein
MNRANSMPNSMLLEIQQWITGDRSCLARKARLLELWKQKRQTTETYRKAELDSTHYAEREIKKLSPRLSHDERKRRQVEIFNRRAVEHRKLFLAMRHRLRKLDAMVEAAAIALGKRQGFLRSHYGVRYTLIAQRERNRIARRNGVQADTVTQD